MLPEDLLPGDIERDDQLPPLGETRGNRVSPELVTAMTGGVVR